VFFSLEFNRLDDAHLAALLAANADLARYKPVFDRMRAMRRTSCRTSWKSSCTTSPPWAPPPGTGCSTKPWPA
jgi:hypothetical protein